MRPVAIVTGASAGIGEAFARLLAPEYDLVLVARREERLRELATSLGGEGQAHRVVALDLALPDADERLWAQAPRCDLLVNNAGFGYLARLDQLAPERLAALIDLNVRTLSLLCRRYLPQLLERRAGGIINVASLGAFTPTARMAAYTASKSYVLAFSEALREEVRGTGVHISCLCPGPAETEFADVAGVDVDRAYGPRVRKLVFESAESVARAGLGGLRRNRAIVAPGWATKTAVWGQRLVPRALFAWLAGRVMAR
jgi:uncharacterized protein